MRPSSFLMWILNAEFTLDLGFDLVDDGVQRVADALF